MGFPLRKLLRFLNKFKTKKKTNSVAFWRGKKEIVTYHLKHNPFYKNFAKNAAVFNWNSIPIMTKRDLQ